MNVVLNVLSRRRRLCKEKEVVMEVEEEQKE
jgi:hypothetical protein